MSGVPPTSPRRIARESAFASRLEGTRDENSRLVDYRTSRSLAELFSHAVDDHNDELLRYTSEERDKWRAWFEQPSRERWTQRSNPAAGCRRSAN